MKGGMEMKNEGTHTWDSDGPVVAFMDAGEASALVCVESATAANSAVIEARCRRGDVRFIVEFGGEKQDVRCRVIGMNAFLRSPSLEFLHLELDEGRAKALRRGESIRVPSTNEGLEWLKSNYVHRLGSDGVVWTLSRGREFGQWIDFEGRAIHEPAWFRMAMTIKWFYGLQNWAKEEAKLGVARHCFDEASLLRLVLDAYAKTLPRRMAEDEFEDLESACEVLRDVSEEINQHIKLGDFTPNPETVKKFIEIFGDGGTLPLDDLDEREDLTDYEEELLYCAEQVMRSKSTGYRNGVPVPRKYSAFRYPKTCVAIEQL